MDPNIDRLENDALQRFEDYAALTVEALNARLSVAGFKWEPPGPFFTHEATGVTVNFSAGGYRVTWPLLRGGMGSAEFPVAGSVRLPCDLAQHLVWACEWRREHEA